MLRIATPPQSATPSASFSGSYRHVIRFKHPGYADESGQNVLLQLHSFDAQHGGLHYGTALVACAIIAGNAWNGYFTRERNGDGLQMGFDDILTEASYYFYVPSSSSDTDRYPVCPSFEHWSFPHDDLPSWWSAVASLTTGPEEVETMLAPLAASNLTMALLLRDGCCRMTGQRDYIQSAHLCPRSQTPWFESNRMGSYNLNGQLADRYIVDDTSNAIALRPDCHSAFDDKKFVIVPKESKWVIHFLGITNDLGRLYHNTAIELDSSVSMNFILARFAWAIFPLVRQFLEIGTARELWLRTICDGAIRKISRMVDGEEVKTIGTGFRSRSMSPKKRKAGSVTPTPDSLVSRKRRYRDVDTGEESSGEENPINSASASGFSQIPGLRVTQPLDGEVSGQNDTLNEDAPMLTTFGEHSELESSKIETPETNHDMKKLKRDWIERQRPTDPALYCCDYNAAEAADRAGIPGKREYGGRKLCFECLGFEYLSIPADLDDPEDS